MRHSRLARSPLSPPLIFFSSPSSFRWVARSANERKYVQMRSPETSCRSTTIRIVINQPCARINRDVTTLFCRSSAFSPRIVLPVFPRIRDLTDFFARITTADTWRQANSTQRCFNREKQSHNLWKLSRVLTYLNYFNTQSSNFSLFLTNFPTLSRMFRSLNERMLRSYVLFHQLEIKLKVFLFCWTNNKRHEVDENSRKRSVATLRGRRSRMNWKS